MSGNLAQSLATAQAETNAKLDSVATDVTEIGADVDTLLANMNPGDVVTQDMVDAAQAISARVGAVKDGLDAINAKVPAPTQPTPPVTQDPPVQDPSVPQAGSEVVPPVSPV